MKFKHFLIVVALLVLTILIAFPLLAPVQAQTLWTKFRNVHVEHDLDVDGDVDVDGTLNADGVDFDGSLDVAGDTALGDAAGDTTTITGDMTVAGLRDGTTGYDYFVTIEGEATGVITGAKTIGMYVGLERSSSYPITPSGDLADTGLQVRVETEATSTIAGTVLRAVDAEAKADNPSGTVSNLFGGSFTAKSDTGAGSVDSMIGLQSNVQNNAAVGTTLISSDFRLMRQAATEPTTEYVTRVRNSSTSGSGADAAIYVESDYSGSATTDSFGYGLDMNGAVVNTAEIRLQNEETIANTTDGQIDIGGNLYISGARDASTGYDYFGTITGEATGVVTGAKTIGLIVEMDRSSSYPITPSGDLADTGLMVRVETEATSTIAGTVLRAVDAEAKADNPSGTVSNLFGGSFTAKSDTGAGTVNSMIGLQSNVQNNAAVDTTLISADFRLYRQAATHPTTEYVTRIRSSSSTGSGADAAIYVESDYAGSATTDSFDYGLDMSGAAINTADIRMENGETISNGTDTAVQVGGFLALTEGTVVEIAAGGTITPLASYQPIETSESGSTTTSTSTAIADGAVAGALLILCNEDAQDIVIDDGANTDIGGNQTLTGGADDCLWLIWNGADWNKIAEIGDN